MIEILDTANIDEFTVMRNLYTKEGFGFIIIFDITNEQTFQSVEERIQEIMRKKRMRSVKMVIVGNKTDLEPSRVVSSSRGSFLTKKYPNCSYLEISAKSNLNIDKLFVDLVERCYKSFPFILVNKQKNKNCNLF